MSAVRQSKSPLDLTSLRGQIPILGRTLYAKPGQPDSGVPLVYLDNAATTQKPQVVLDAVARYYQHSNANVHRAAHALADEATTALENARSTLADFLNAPRQEEVVFTRGTTEAINLVAASLGEQLLVQGDVILISMMEHHSNIVPWQLAAERTGALVVPIPVTAAGELDMAAYGQLLASHGRKVRVVAVGHVSNALGTINPVAEISRKAHAVGALVLVDGAQATAHLQVDVQALGADFYALSGHKMYAPTGIGALWGRYDLLAVMPPWQGGGEMIDTVSFTGSTWQAPPFRFEAGTPNIGGAVGLAAAINWLRGFDRSAVAAHEADLLGYALARLRQVEGLQLVGEAKNRIGAISFLLAGGHPHDVGTLLDRQGVAVRTGHHCTQPLMAQLGIPGTVRASLALYNTRADIDALVAALEKTRSFL